MVRLVCKECVNEFDTVEEAREHEKGDDGCMPWGRCEYYVTDYDY